MKKPIIFEYHSYRKYFKDIFTFLKTQKLSMRKIAKNIQVSAAYFTMVIQGKRSFDLKYLDSFSAELKLKKHEINFLKNLIILADSEDLEKKHAAYKKLSRNQQFKNLNNSEYVTYNYLSHWYYSAIRELSFLDDFELSTKYIQNKLTENITKQEIEKAIKFLSKNNLLAKSINSNVSQIHCVDGIYNLSLKKYHKDMLEVAKNSLDSVEHRRRNILGFTKSLDSKSFQKAKEIMEKAIADLEKLQPDQKNLDTYHFYFLGFPLSSKKEDT